MNRIKIYYCNDGYELDGTTCKEICPDPTNQPTHNPTIPPATVCGLKGYEVHWAYGTEDYERCKNTMWRCASDWEPWFIQGCGCGCKPKCVPIGDALWYYPKRGAPGLEFESNICGVMYEPLCGELTFAPGHNLIDPNFNNGETMRGRDLAWQIEGCGCGCHTLWTNAIENINSYCEENIYAQYDWHNCPVKRVIAMGSPRYDGSNPPECISELTDGTASNGRKISTRCCRVDGQKGKSTKATGECFGDAPYYSLAKSRCENPSYHGYDFEMRLCTRQELKANKVKGTGCGYDARYIWTSDTCDGNSAMKVDEIAYEGQLDTHANTDTDKDNGNDNWIMTSIVSVSGVVFVLALSLGALFCYRRRNSKAKAKAKEEEKGKDIEENGVEPELVKDASVTNTTTAQMEMAELDVADVEIVENEKA